MASILNIIKVQQRSLGHQLNIYQCDSSEQFPFHLHIFWDTNISMKIYLAPTLLQDIFDYRPKLSLRRDSWLLEHLKLCLQSSFFCMMNHDFTLLMHYDWIDSETSKLEHCNFIHPRLGCTYKYIKGRIRRRVSLEWLVRI